MATTKSFTALYSGTLVSAAAIMVTSATVTMDTGYGAGLSIKLTNGGTGPTVATQVRVQVSQDNTEFYDYGGPLVGSTVASAIVAWGGIDIPIGIEFLRLLVGSNTGQNVTIDADVSVVTAIA